MTMPRSTFVKVRAARSALQLASDPNVIPFIDVLLVLLVIFMVTAPSPTVDIKVDMPRPSARPAPVIATIVALNAEGDGLSVTVDGAPAALESVADAAFAHARADNPTMALDDVLVQAPVMVRADQAIAYGRVVDVMDRLQRGGFQKVGVFQELAQN